MKNKTKKIVSALLTLCMLAFFIPANVFAANPAEHINYVALGDSITTGYGLADKSDLFVNKLTDKENCSVDNYAIDGMNSEMMLDSLQKQDIYFKAFSDQYTKVYITTSIADADIITLSIGGNDLLGPFIEALKNVMGKIPTTDMQTGLAALLSDTEAMTQLKANMTAGVASFVTNFPQIVAALKAINPNAKIVVQTIYNPFDNAANILKMSDDQKIIFAGLNDALEAALTSMNDLIKQGATITQGPVTVTNYLVADVYNAFKANNAGGSLLTNIANNDIHPNALGHDVIYTAIYTVLAPTGLTAFAPTTWFNNDGIITGVTAEMEYRLSAKSEYSPVTGTSITGLAAGTYCIRYAAKTGTNAGLDAVITVPESSGFFNMGIIFLWLNNIHGLK